MNFHFYIEKLFSGEEFKKFIEENKDAYPCGGFFVIDLENLKNPDNKNHVDYFVPSINKMFSFQLEEGVKMVLVENQGEVVPKEIKINYNFDFEEIEKLILEKMSEEKVDKKIQKILLSLQNKDGKDFFVGTVFVSGMGLINVHIDVDDMKVTNFESKSFMDMINVFKKDKKNLSGSF